MPLYMMDALSHIPGACGLFISGIFSASLSTISSCLNSLAAVTLQDFVKPAYKFITKKSWESDSALCSKIIAGLFGIVCILVAFAAQHFGGVLQASLIIFGVVGGPLLALFTLGMTTKIANQIGSTIGLLIGIALTFWIGFGQPKPPMRILDVSTEDCTSFDIFNVTQPIKPAPHDPADYFILYRISYMYGVVLGFLATFICGYLLSFVLKKLKIQDSNRIYLKTDSHTINSELFLPPIAKRMERKNDLHALSVSRLNL
jgi:sodium-coupled monocarboxylate transporter 8/12